jgi:hypothetical protein
MYFSLTITLQLQEESIYHVYTIHQILVNSYSVAFCNWDKFQAASNNTSLFLIIYRVLKYKKSPILHSLMMLYKHTSQKLYICDPQQHNNFFTLPKKCHHMFRPLRVIFRWYFWRFLTLLRYIHHLYKCEAIYCLLICMYTMLRKQ